MTTTDLIAALREPGALLRGTGKLSSLYLLQRPGQPDVKVQRVQIAKVRDTLPLVFEANANRATWRMQ